MGLTFENQGSQSYYVYSFAANEDIDTMSLGMITNNRIEGFLPALYTQMDGERQIKYNVTSMIPMSELFEGEVKKAQLLGIFRSITGAILAADEYMLMPESLLLDEEAIFVRTDTNEAFLICLPVVNESASQDFELFFKRVMFSTRFDPNESSDYVAKILTYLNGRQGFSVQQFHELLEQLLGSVQNASRPDMSTYHVQNPVNAPGAVEKKVPKQQPYVQQPVARAYEQPVVQRPQPPQPQKVPVEQKIPVQGPTQETEEKMSWFYLMQHYNKENAAIYRRQKEREAAQKPKKEPKEEKKGKASKPAPKKKHEDTGFAVPGAPIPAKQSGSIPASNPSQQPTANPYRVPGAAVQQAPIDLPKINKEPIRQSAGNFGETVVLSTVTSGGETTVLSPTTALNSPIPYLVRAKNGERIAVDKPVFRIGKERSYVDYFIGDNSAISRSHANIITRDGAYYIVDTNSTNHTFVNGTVIQSDTEVAITSGTKLRLANEDFLFELM